MKSKIIQVLCAVGVFFGALWFIVERDSQKNEEDVVPVVLRASHAYQAALWLNDMRAHPTGEIPPEWKARAFETIAKEQASLSKTSTPGTQLSWRALGPTNFGGRLRSILIDPQHPDTLYVGSVSGGIWKTTNAGGTWFPTSDLADNMCIGTIVMDPTNPDIIYAGTGEGYFNIDALRGAGVLKSTDGGASWSLQTNFIGTISWYQYYYINKLVIRPDDPNVLYAAMVGGIFKTTDGGAKWTKLTVPNTSPYCMDLVANPQDPDIMYASFGLFLPTNDGIYKTTDGGTNWTKLTNGFPSTSTGYTRISLAISPSDPNILYASVSDSQFYTHSIMKTTNGGALWFKSSVSPPYDNSPDVKSTHLGGQGFYNNVIAVHPQNPNIVYAGGINILKSLDGGSSWTVLIDGNRVTNFHVDQHVITFHPNNPAIVYFGNDGGIYRSTNNGSTFTNINTNLTTAQFYTAAMHPTEEIYYGGTQDNGTLRSSYIPLWSRVLGGDGGPVLVDVNDPSTVYLSYVYMTIYKSTNGGNTTTLAMNGIPSASQRWTSDRCSFIAPLAMDPNNPQIIYGGTYRLYRTLDGAASWTTLTSDLTGSGGGSVQTDGSTITAIAVAKSNSSVLYVGTSGDRTSRSKVLVSTNGGSSWTATGASLLPNRAVSSITVDPLNADRAFVVLSGFTANTPTTPGHVFITTNRCTSWTNISGNLPDVPVNTLILDPQTLNHYIIGTDLGVFETTNGGSSWIQQNSGMANVAVFQLALRQDGYILAATHGRGMFISSADLYSGLALFYPSQNDTTIGSSVTLRWKHSDSTSFYRLVVATDPSFSTGIFFSDTTLTDTTKTITGLASHQTYYWQVSIKKPSGNISASPIWSFTTIISYPSSFHVSESVSFPDHSNPGNYSPSDYRLVGLPGDGNSRIDSMLGGAHKTDWQLYWDNGGASDYFVEFNGGSDFRFSKGRAFWLLNKGNWNINATVPAVPLVSQAVAIPLHSGWNLITNPYNTSVTWETVKEANGITDPLWGFNGNFVSSTVMLPTSGYYYYNSPGQTALTIPYGNTVGKRTVAGSETIQWKIDFTLRSGSYGDESASCGVAQNASNGFDGMDARRPRAMGDLPAVYFLHPEWDENYSVFATDYKPEFSDQQSWTFTAHCTNGVKSELFLAGISRIPQMFDVYLIDIERGTVQDLWVDSSYQMVDAGTDVQFELVVGRNDAIKDRLDHVLPVKYYLSNNYPNPFNPSTSFEYRLPEAGFVTCKVFNMAGQEVATLVNEQQAGGTYTITWNAGQVSSGIYFVRFHAGDFSSVKKVLLVK